MENKSSFGRVEVNNITELLYLATTNQDIIAIGALAKYGKVTGDFSRYNEYGKPAFCGLACDDHY